MILYGELARHLPVERQDQRQLARVAVRPPPAMTTVQGDGRTDFLTTGAVLAAVTPPVPSAQTASGRGPASEGVARESRAMASGAPAAPPLASLPTEVAPPPAIYQRVSRGTSETMLRPDG